MRLVAYCRVSTDKDEQLESLANQQEFFESFAERTNNTLIKMYSDEGISGKQMKNRKAFLQLMEDAKLGLFDVVAVKDISRFARNTVDFLVSIRELKALNIDVQFVSVNQTVLGNSEFILTMFSALAQEESANLSNRVKFGKKINAKNGKVPNFVYGYNWIDRYTLEINEEQAEVVRKIFHLYANEGMGSRRIAILLTEKCIPTTKNTNRWIPTTIRRMLSNPLYKGVLVSRKTEGVNYLTGERKKIEDISGEYTFYKPELAIVDEETFEKAAKRLAENKQIYLNKEPNNRVSSKYPFSTLIKCEHCGYSFTRRIAKLRSGDVIRWRCAGNNNNNSEFCPNKVVIDEESLLNEIRDYLYEKIKDKNKFVRDFENARKTQIRKQNTHIDYQSEINKLETRKEKYKNMYVNEIIDLSTLKTHIEEIDKQINSYYAQMLSQNQPDNRSTLTAKELYEYILEVLNGNLSNVAMKKIIEKISVNSNGDTNIIWK